MAGKTQHVKYWRYVVPNFFTSLNLSMGTASIILSLDGKPYWGAWLVLWSVLLDKADGTAARLLGSSSRFGSELDSMADLVAFGLAPALLIFATGRQQWAVEGWSLAWFLSMAGVFLYPVCTALRLARFNVSEHSSSERYFEGLPTTVCGAIVASALLVGFKYQLPVELMRYFPVVLIILGLGMVSNLLVPKVVPRKNKAFNLFQIANILATYVFGAAMIFPEYLLGLAVFFLVVGITHACISQRMATNKA